MGCDDWPFPVEPAFSWKRSDIVAAPAVDGLAVSVAAVRNAGAVCLASLVADPALLVNDLLSHLAGNALVLAG